MPTRFQHPDKVQYSTAGAAGLSVALFLGCKPASLQSNGDLSISEGAKVGRYARQVNVP